MDKNAGVSSTDQTVERRRDGPDPVAAEFVLRLGRAMQVYGMSARRLEDLLGAAADRLRLTGHQFFSTPTSIMASFGPVGRQRTHMLRTEPGEVNLGKLAELYPKGGDVTIDDLVEKGAVRKNERVKVLGDGDIQVKLNVAVDKVSGSAEQKIVAAGGSVK